MSVLTISYLYAQSLPLPIQIGIFIPSTPSKPTVKGHPSPPQGASQWSGPQSSSYCSLAEFDLLIMLCCFLALTLWLSGLHKLLDFLQEEHQPLLLNLTAGSSSSLDLNFGMFQSSSRSSFICINFPDLISFITLKYHLHTTDSQIYFGSGLIPELDTRICDCLINISTCSFYKHLLELLIFPHKTYSSWRLS